MTTNNANAIVAIAQELQVRREEWKAKLEQLPMPGVKVKFPYGSMEAAIADKFALLANGEEADPMAIAFAILVKGYKTVAWRKAADKNRETRDDIADGNVPVVKAKRVRKPKAVAEQAATEAAS
jgi:hypothetical protein